MPLAVEVDDLSKRYEPAGVQALAGVSFSVSEGEVFGLLGRNGAGKSTTVRILTTLLRPTSGTARVGGHDVARQPAEVRALLGAALQEAALDDLMTGREHLLLGARLGGLTKAAAAERTDELLESLGLRLAADRMAAGYSGGMRRRLDVAMAMLRRPRVLFLDEPTTGLDPQGRRALWGIIRDLRDTGSTVVLTTQHMAEADALAGRVAVVHQGAIAAVGSPEELKDRLGGATVVRLRVAPDQLPILQEELNTGSIGVVASDGDGEWDGEWLVLAVGGGGAAVAALIGRIVAAGVGIEGLDVESPTLEDVFVNLTGDEIESISGPVAASTLSAVRRGTGMAFRGER